jgi:hypothetical protein
VVGETPLNPLLGNSTGSLITEKFTAREFAFTNESMIHLPVIGGLPEIAFTAAQLYEKTGVKQKLAG